MTKRDRVTGATGRVLDADALTVAIAERYPEDYDNDTVAETGQVLVQQHGTGTYAVVCSEGVGWEVQGDGHIRVLARTGRYTVDTLTLPIGVVVDAALDEIDLSKVVRSFGARLETNFGIWYEFVTGKHTWEVE